MLENPSATEWEKHVEECLARANRLILSVPADTEPHRLWFEYQEGQYRVGEEGRYRICLPLSVPVGVPNLLDEDDLQQIDQRAKEVSDDYRQTYRTELINGKMCWRAANVYERRSKELGLGDLLNYRLVYGGKNEFQDYQLLSLEAEQKEELGKKLDALEKESDIVRHFAKEIFLAQSPDFILGRIRHAKSFDEERMRMAPMPSDESRNEAVRARKQNAWRHAWIAAYDELMKHPFHATWREAVESLGKEAKTVENLLYKLNNPFAEQPIYEAMLKETLQMIPLLGMELPPLPPPGLGRKIRNLVTGLGSQ